MNIAVVTSGYLPVPPTKGGAVENLIYNLIKANENQEDHKMVVYSIEDDCFEKFNNTVIKYIHISVLSRIFDFMLYNFAKNVLRKKHLISYRYFFQRIEFMNKVGRDLAKNNYDKVVLENNVIMFKTLEYKDNFKKYAGKLYYHAHNELGKTLGYEKYLKKLTKVIGVSDYITAQYQNQIASKDVAFSTVHNVVDEIKFMKDASAAELEKIKKELKIDNDFITILFTGRISEEKGILELIEALSKLKTEKYNLLIVGKSFYGAKVKDSFEARLREESSKLRGNVVFTGFVDYKDMYKYYQLADLCVLPSVWNEPCALTVIECISSGTPLITTCTGGTPENAVKSTILLDVNGLVDELAEVLGHYISDQSALAEFKRQARQERNHFGTVQDYYNRFIDELRGSDFGK